ncbi:MAG: hypothetical protein JW846_00585 [Dehalococcoidia bacterium]|nr:hypothetical protein [Dehalococcoidia bacterium]
MKPIRSFVLALFAAVLLLPLSAGTAEAAVHGAPDLEALVVGDDEFQVGSVGTLELMIQNIGSFDGRVTGADDQVLAYGYNMGGMMVAYPATTAQNLTVTLESSSPTIDVVAGTSYVGVLPHSYVTPQPLRFDVRVYRYADVGTYELELKLTYEYIKDVDWLNPPDSLPLPPNPDAYNAATYQPHFQFTREQVTETIPVTIKVVGSYFEAVRTDVEGLRPGTSGIVSVTLGNNGETAYDVTAEVVASGNFIPVDRASYLGTVDAGSRVTTDFKVAVSQDAISKTSPLTVLVKYTDKKDVDRVSTVTAGVDIMPAVDFAVTAAELEDELKAGGKRALSVSIQNTSDVDLTDAVARINAIDPFSSTDDTAYIGEFPAGAIRVAVFSIAADDDATAKPYALDVDLRYKDSNGDSHTSDVLKANVVVGEPDGMSSQTALLLAVAGIALGGGAYLAVRFFSKRRKTIAAAELSAS